MTDQELQELSIEERNLVLDAWMTERDRDIKDAQDEQYAELLRDYRLTA